MREHPILFSAPMIRAILEDRKFVTRRLSERWLKVRAGDRLWVRETCLITNVGAYTPGDILPPRAEVGIAFRADHPTGDLLDGDGGYNFYAIEGEREIANARRLAETHYDRWIPSIHMPRWASRILLECEEDARRERLWEITREEAEAEGVSFASVDHIREELHHDLLIAAFATLWGQLHTKPGERWEDNPMVTRVGRFRRIA